MSRVSWNRGDGVAHCLMRVKEWLHELTMVSERLLYMSLKLHYSAVEMNHIGFELYSFRTHSSMIIIEL